MTEEICGVEHPDVAGVTCDKRMPCWEYHDNSRHDLSWPGIPYPEVGTKAKAETKLHEIRDKTAPAERTGPPAVRRTDPVTSHKAAEDITVRSGSHRARLLAVYQVAKGPMSDHQAAQAARMPDRSCWWKRCSELVHGGYIEEVGEVMDPMTGSMVRTCVVTPKGLAESI